MKKILLSVAVLATFLAANAQTRFTIYDGSATDILVGNAYGFNGLTKVKSDSTFAGETFWFVGGEVEAGGKYYVGGTGNANFKKLPELATSFGLDIKALNSATFALTYATDVEINVDVDLEQQLLSSKGTDSTILVGTTTFNLKPTLSLVPGQASKPLTAFKKAGADLTTADFARVSKITLKVSLTTEKGAVNAAFDNIVVIDGEPTSVSDATLAQFNNETVAVYNLSGALVTTGTVDNLNLASGLYILKSASHTAKVVIK